ncbi:hypothetical protein ACTA71_011171 [Dictyostelium dimigraforme]
MKDVQNPNWNTFKPTPGQKVLMEKWNCDALPFDKIKNIKLIKGRDLVWRYLLKAIPKRYEDKCIHCKNTRESSEHLFFTCPKMKPKCQLITDIIATEANLGQIKWEEAILKRLGNILIANLIASIMEILWSIRTNLKFNNSKGSITTELNQQTNKKVTNHKGTRKSNQPQKENNSKPRKVQQELEFTSHANHLTGSPPRMPYISFILPNKKTFGIGEDDFLKFDAYVDITDIPDLEISNVVSNDSSSGSSSPNSPISPRTGYIPGSTNKEVDRINSNPNSTTLEAGDYSTFQSHVRSIISAQKAALGNPQLLKCTTQVMQKSTHSALQIT